AEAGDLLRMFGDAFPEAYKEDFDGAAAYLDIRRLLELHGWAASTRPRLYRDTEDEPGERRMKVYRAEEISLTDVLPVFAHLGLEVTVQRPYEVDLPDGTTSYVYDFGLRAASESV